MIIRHLFSIALLITFLLPSANSACGDVGDTVVCVEVPQSILISSDATYTHKETLETVFKVESNAWLDLSFSGTSKSDTGQELDYPRFHKIVVDADGANISNRYDHLETTAGVRVTNATMEVVEINSWQLNSNDPIGTPEHLVLPLNQTLATPDSPDASIGGFLPLDDEGTNRAKVRLFTKGKGTVAEQSGIYRMTITLIVTAQE